MDLVKKSVKPRLFLLLSLAGEVGRGRHHPEKLCRMPADGDVKNLLAHGLTALQFTGTCYPRCLHQRSSASQCWGEACSISSSLPRVLEWGVDGKRTSGRESARQHRFCPTALPALGQHDFEGEERRGSMGKSRLHCHPTVERQRGGIRGRWLCVLCPHRRSGCHSAVFAAAWGLLGSSQHSTALSSSPNPCPGPALHTHVQTLGAQIKRFSPVPTTTHQHQRAKAKGRAGGSRTGPGSGQI